MSELGTLVMEIRLPDGWSKRPVQGEANGATVRFPYDQTPLVGTSLDRPCYRPLLDPGLMRAYED